MAPAFEISVPSATTASPADTKPYTAYQISIRLPLRTYTLSKRYSDFTTFHIALTQQASKPPPASLPPKHFFSSTINNPELTEERRRGLEVYLQTISAHEDARWRDTSAWRSFLNLPPASHTASTKSSAAGNLHSAYTSASSGASDPTVWLDTHRETVSFLQTAKERLAARNSAQGPTAQQQEGASAKKALVRAGTLLQTLEKGLKGSGDGWGEQRLGEGEIRRRRDLLSAARKERDRLEELQANIGRKEEYDEDIREKEQVGAVPSRAGALFSGSGSRQGGRGAVGKGRVLGKETAQTRELDNNGVLQLQQQVMQDQDESINALAAAVRRQRDLASQINEELEVQTEILDGLDDDVTRLDGKLKVARKRVDKIS